ncbi:hypothetical protein Sros01_23110 [Streptomyces roseochromogenus]|nr:hypothetical protein Sros01_23110 [Streptomyces roseochromogenus]
MRRPYAGAVPARDPICPCAGRPRAVAAVNLHVHRSEPASRPSRCGRASRYNPVMTLTPHRSGALLLALSAALFPVLPSPAAASADPGPLRHHRHTAEEITRFLTTFYGKHGPTEQDRALRVSQQLKTKQEHTRDSDVVLCSVSAPREIEVGPATVAPSAGVGWATVTTSWDSGATDTFTAYVRLDSLPIQLDDVICAG